MFPIQVGFVLFRIIFVSFIDDMTRTNTNENTMRCKLQTDRYGQIGSGLFCHDWEDKLEDNVLP